MLGPNVKSLYLNVVITSSFLWSMTAATAAYAKEPQHMLERRSLWDLFRRTPVAAATTTRNVMVQVDEGIIIESQDQVYGDIAELRRSCIIYIKEMIELQEKQADAMNAFSGDGRSVLEQVEKDITFNGCQNLVNVFNAYHETLIGEDKPLPYYLVAEQERKKHKKSRGTGEETNHQ